MVAAVVRLGCIGVGIKNWGAAPTRVELEDSGGGDVDVLGEGVFVVFEGEVASAISAESQGDEGVKKLITYDMPSAHTGATTSRQR